MQMLHRHRDASDTSENASSHLTTMRTDSSPSCYDLSTTLKAALMKKDDHRRLVICGQWSSHCNGFDVLQLVDELVTSDMKASNVIVLKDGKFVMLP